MSDPAAVVRRYFGIVADLGSPAEALLELLHPDVRVGKRLLAAQAIEIHELVVSGERVAVRATWKGTIGQGSQALAAGTQLVAHTAAWLSVADGRIREHDTFDCYEPVNPLG